MNERVADAVDLIGGAGLSVDQSAAALKSHAASAEDKELPEELFDYLAVAPRSSRKLRVKYRDGARLQPLPYPLDEENP
jgi:hypothetical protein